MKETSINVRLSEKLREALKKRADIDDVPESHIVRQALVAYLPKRKPKSDRHPEREPS